jgi:hypothetical protein
MLASRDEREGAAHHLPSDDAASLSMGQIEGVCRARSCESIRYLPNHRASLCNALKTKRSACPALEMFVSLASRYDAFRSRAIFAGWLGRDK